MSARPATTARSRQEATDGGNSVLPESVKYLLLTSVKPDGRPATTAVRVAPDGDRAYFRLSSASATARRLRRCDWVQVAPSSVLGFIRYGPPAGATVRLLAGAEASRAARHVDRGYPAWRGFPGALLHRVTGWRHEYYEVRADAVAAALATGSPPPVDVHPRAAVVCPVTGPGDGWGQRGLRDPGRASRLPRGTG